MLSRLLRMGIGEVTDRGRQEASKWLERRSMRLRGERGHAGAMPSTPGMDARIRRTRFAKEAISSSPATEWEQFKTSSPLRFFEGAGEESSLALLNTISPAARSQTLEAAERILMSRFDLLGYTNLDFGDPIDWRLDPVSGRRSPAIHWSLLDPTDFALIGDCKVVWELSRQAHLVTLGVAYRISGDERYSEGFVQLIRGWLESNPPGVGINWASSLEVSLRMVAWSWSLLLFRNSDQLTPEVFADVAAALESHAAHVERYLSRHSSPNTHLTGEALGLFYAGVLFPESTSATRRRELGRKILDEQISIQVLRDGVYFEQSTAYQSYTIEIYLHYLILASRNRIHVWKAVSESVQRMLDVLLALRRPDGGMPMIGDADGGALLRLAPRAPGDARGLFSAAAAFFGRPDYAWAAEGVQPEAWWFLGSSALSSIVAMGAAPPREGSRTFSAGGYAVMRSGWQRDAHHLIFDAGPLGCPLTAAHGHADLLSVQVSPFGEPCIVDPGTFAYAADPEARDYFRGTGAHSTVMVDGVGQAEPGGPFKWRDRPAANLRSFLSTRAFDFADASHDAYRRLPDPVVHRRRVVFVKSPGYWVIVDDLLGTAGHRVDLRFQFAPLHLQMLEDDWLRTIGPSGRGLLLRPFATAPLSVRVALGSEAPLEGWVSQNYGQRQPAPSLVFSTQTGLPLRILTLLVPASYATMEPPSVQSLRDENGLPFGLSFADGRESIRFDADTFTIEGPATCRA